MSVRIARTLRDVPDPPRDVDFWPCLRSRLGTIVAGGVLALGSLLLGAAICVCLGRLPPGADFYLMVKITSTTPGTVILTEPVESPFVRPGMHRVRFTYSVDGTEYEMESYTGDSRLIYSYVPGRRYPVIYDPDEPSRAKLAQTEAALVPWWAFAVLLGAHGVGILALALGLNRARVDREVLESGQTAVGRVTQAYYRARLGANRIAFVVAYSFEDLAGELHRGRFTIHEKGLSEIPVVGDPVVVVLDEGRPWRNVLWLIRSEGPAP